MESKIGVANAHIIIFGWCEHILMGTSSDINNILLQTMYLFHYKCNRYSIANDIFILISSFGINPCKYAVVFNWEIFKHSLNAAFSVETFGRESLQETVEFSSSGIVLNFRKRFRK